MSTPARARSRRVSEAVSRIAQPSTASPAPSASSGTAPSRIDVTPYIATQSGARRGRSSGHGWRALPDFTAGEPFQYWPALTLPTTPEPGATSAFLPIDGAGQQRGPRADGGVVADGDRADVEEVAVDPVPGEVDLRLDGAAVAERQHAGDGRGRVQVDALADPVAERAGVVHQPRCARQVLGAAGLAEPFGEPDPQVHRAAAAVGARLRGCRSGCARRGPRWPSGPTG